MLDKKNNSHIDGNGNIVIQDLDNSTITINLANNEQIRKFLIDFQQRLSELPIDVLNELKKHNELETELKVGANIYLTVIGAFPEVGKNAVLWGITITNLTKEIRYFNQPYFKVSPIFELEEGLEHDTFMLFPKERIRFPFRLEYGQVLNISYQINPSQFALFEKNSTDEAFIQAFCGTTVGELYNSNEYQLRKFVREYQAILSVK